MFQKPDSSRLRTAQHEQGVQKLISGIADYRSSYKSYIEKTRAPWDHCGEASATVLVLMEELINAHELDAKTFEFSIAQGVTTWLLSPVELGRDNLLQLNRFERDFVEQHVNPRMAATTIRRCVYNPHSEVNGALREGGVELAGVLSRAASSYLLKPDEEEVLNQYSAAFCKKWGNQNDNPLQDIEYQESGHVIALVRSYGSDALGVVDFTSCQFDQRVPLIASCVPEVAWMTPEMGKLPLVPEQQVEPLGIGYTISPGSFSFGSIDQQLEKYSRKKELHLERIRELKQIPMLNNLHATV